MRNSWIFMHDDIHEYSWMLMKYYIRMVIWLSWIFMNISWVTSWNNSWIFMNPVYDDSWTIMKGSWTLVHGFSWIIHELLPKRELMNSSWTFRLDELGHLTFMQLHELFMNYLTNFDEYSWINVREPIMNSSWIFMNYSSTSHLGCGLKRQAREICAVCIWHVRKLGIC